MNIDQRNRIVSIVLIVVILFLGYWLYVTITGPWQEVQRERAVTEQVRDNLMAVNEAIRFYNEQNNRFPVALDSLMVFLTANERFMANPDSVLRNRRFDANNFFLSPRTGNRFEYALNDSARPPLYLLSDPDSDDHIGTLTRVTDRGAPSWR
ncbi:MAG: hypothetical protein LAT75_00265 [Candidatus Cyclonatronum sp.]|uniref:hypothetical protein n=1 Tax=Cyclonatronum sp. TaxID=3024185 RepID=UPI0025C6D2FA|nr:hypothetical protein [Cyclonatronum sp.]MCH8485265.1 hypothetical protein [Cyclonatronum sp.]